MRLEDSKIAIIGLGYVGLPLAVEFSKKFPVVGFDINNTRVNELNNGHDVTLCLLYTSPSPRDRSLSRMPSSA